MKYRLQRGTNTPKELSDLILAGRNAHFGKEVERVASMDGNGQQDRAPCSPRSVEPEFSEPHQMCDWS